MKAIWPIVLLLALAGCSDKPSESDARQTIEQQFAACDGLTKIENFKKTNGRDVDANHYEVEVQYDVVLTSDVLIPQGQVPRTFPAPTLCVWNAFFSMYHGNTGIYPAGTKLHVEPTDIGYVKTEKGWVPGY